ncbi:MAG: hypothetical protein DIU69_11215, partial [Bacillota bacterium]
ISPGRPGALARALRTVAGDPILAGRLAEAGHRYVLRHHSHLEAARRFLEIYELCRQVSRAGERGGQSG